MFDREIRTPSKTALNLPALKAFVDGDYVFFDVLGQQVHLDANDAIRLMAFLARAYRNEFGADPRTEKPTRKVGGRA